MEGGIVSLLLVAYISVASALYGPKSDVIELTAANFQDKVVNGNELWLVEFYAPWCGHCKSLAPEWEKAAKALKGVVKVGAVDMDVHSTVGGPYNVRGFPTIKVFGGNKNSPQDYQGARTASGIVEEGLKAAKKLVNDRLNGKGGGKSGGGGGGSGAGNEKDVVELTDANFEKLVLNGKEPWLVEFFAPWCGHCQRLAPEWTKAATELKGKIKLGTVDATVHTVVASKFQVLGYPTIKFFPAGDKDYNSAEEYNGNRTASDIINWGLDKFADSIPPPEVYEILDETVVKENCDDKPLCIISFLPHILDSGAQGRNKYLTMLKDMGDVYKKKQWGWLWTAQFSQTTLEESLGMGGFGYPAMAAVNTRKKVFSILKGSFGATGIYEHLRAVGVGRANSEPIRGDWPVKIAKVERWDGKDGQLPEEDDFDFSDFEEERTLFDLLDLGNFVPNNL